MGRAIGVIGFGEAGSTFARAAGWGTQAGAFDIAAERRPVMADVGVTTCDSLAEALEGASLVLSLVTGDQALEVARGSAPLLEPGALFCDMNSVAPETKRKGAAAVAGGKGRYVDTAVLAPVNPARLAVPLLLSGPDAGEAGEALQAAGFGNVREAGDAVGRASAIKLVRSVMVKGFEALTAEMILAAQAEGVVDDVLASLDASEKAISWRERADYNLDRMLVHGRRRAVEMGEAAEMLRALGIAPLMTDNTVRRQQALGELEISPPPGGLEAKLAAIAAIHASKGEA
ncbi:MAG: DUF1932 domain-containing protein [Novosphingobium sp.]